MPVAGRPLAFRDAGEKLSVEEHGDQVCFCAGGLLLGADSGRKQLVGFDNLGLPDGSLVAIHAPAA